MKKQPELTTVQKYFQRNTEEQVHANYKALATLLKERDIPIEVVLVMMVQAAFDQGRQDEELHDATLHMIAFEARMHYEQSGIPMELWGLGVVSDVCRYIAEAAALMHEADVAVAESPGATKN